MCRVFADVMLYCYYRCAPESLSYHKFYVASDVWSYAVTLWEMFTCGEYPRLCPHYRDLFRYMFNGTRLPMPKNYPRKIYIELLMPCWEFEYKHRCTFAQVCDKITELRKEFGEA